MSDIVYEVTHKRFNPALALSEQEFEQIFQVLREKGHLGPLKDAARIHLTAKRRRRVMTRFKAQFEQKMRAHAFWAMSEAMNDALGIRYD